MKKINKSVLLASTLFISSAITITDKSYANEDYKLDVSKSYDSEDNYINQADQLEDPAQRGVENDADNVSYSANISEDAPEINIEVPANKEVTSENENIDKESSKDSNNTENVSKEVNESNNEENSSSDKNDIKNIEKSQEDTENIIYYDDTDLDSAIHEEKNNESVNLDIKQLGEETEIVEKKYYAPNASGYFVKNKNKVNYYEDNKLVKNANIRVNDKIYRADNTGSISNPKNMWLNIGNDIYYNKEDGSYTKGISQIQDKKYYFSMDGILQRNKKLITNGYYYDVNNIGQMTTLANKWVNVNQNIYRTLDDGSIAKGVTKVGDYDYAFDNEGRLQTNKKLVTQNKYYQISQMGVVTNPKNAWVAVNGITYRTDANGNLVKGIADINNNTYVFDNKTGAMITGRSSITNGRYFNINDKGVATNPKNSWVTHNGKKYHTNDAGYVKEGVWNIDGKLYYFTADGLATNTKVIQKGVEYNVDKNGVATAVDNRIPGERSLDKVIEWMFTARDNKMTYDMGAGRNTAQSADCSSAVYRAMIYGGFLDEGSWIGNTESLFQMGARGSIMYEIAENQIDYGDIFVSGIPGKSLGAGGHTGFILNKADDTIIHMSYSKDGVAVTPRIGNMGDASGRPVKYFRLVGAKSDKTFVNKK